MSKSMAFFSFMWFRPYGFSLIFKYTFSCCVVSDVVTIVYGSGREREEGERGTSEPNEVVVSRAEERVGSPSSHQLTDTCTRELSST